MFRNGFFRCRSHPSWAMPMLPRFGTAATGRFAGDALPFFARTLAGGGGSTP
jgi:hypothetical protein